MKISRRFNHFFLVYAFHLLREFFQVCEHHGSLRFFSRQPEEEPEQNGKQVAPSPALRENSGSFTCPTQSTEERTHSSKESTSDFMVFPTGNKSDVIDASENPTVEPDFLPPTLDLSIVAPGGDDWESKFYERVKMDPNVPSYFKTTLGILLANNRDLRDERAFLHNRLNRS